MIPVSITTALASLQAQVSAALPLANATRPTIQALQLNANALVANIDIAIANAATLQNLTPPSLTVYTIDTWQPPVDPIDIINALNSMLTAATDQWHLVIMRGLVGRVATNLAQLGPAPAIAIPARPTKVYVPTPPAPVVQPPESGQGWWGKFAQQQLKRFGYSGQ